MSRKLIALSLFATCSSGLQFTTKTAQPVTQINENQRITIPAADKNDQQSNSQSIIQNFDSKNRGLPAQLDRTADRDSETRDRIKPSLVTQNIATIINDGQLQDGFSEVQKNDVKHIIIPISILSGQVGLSKVDNALSRDKRNIVIDVPTQLIEQYKKVQTKPFLDRLGVSDLIPNINLNIPGLSTSGVGDLTEIGIYRQKQEENNINSVGKKVIDNEQPLLLCKESNCDDECCFQLEACDNKFAFCILDLNINLCCDLSDDSDSN